MCAGGRCGPVAQLGERTVRIREVRGFDPLRVHQPDPRQTNFVEVNMKMAILCITQDGHFVVMEIDSIDKGVNQALTIFRVIDIAFTELIEEKSDFTGARHRMLGGVTA